MDPSSNHSKGRAIRIGTYLQWVEGGRETTRPPPSHLGCQAGGGAVDLAGYGCSGASGRRQHELLQRGRGRREAEADGGKDGGAEWPKARASATGSGRGRRADRSGWECERGRNRTRSPGG